MMRSLIALAVVFLAGCNTFQTKNVEAEIPVVQGSCPLMASNCKVYKPIADREAATAAAEKLGNAGVITMQENRTEMAYGQQVKTFKSLTIKIPAGAAAARKGDRDVMVAVAGAVRFASNLSTPVTVSLGSQVQRDFATHLISEWKVANVTLAQGPADSIEIRRR